MDAAFAFHTLAPGCGSRGFESHQEARSTEIARMTEIYVGMHQSNALQQARSVKRSEQRTNWWCFSSNGGEDVQQKGRSFQRSAHARWSLASPERTCSRRKSRF
eukprot:6198458-Pleurochrysis_carterae.AAC.2